MNTNWIELICTIGPSSNNPYVLRRMKQLGVTLLRINMSHTSIPQLDKMVKSVRAITDIPICIDTEGAQIRTGNVINNSIELKQGTIVELTKKNIIGNFRIANGKELLFSISSLCIGDKDRIIFFPIINSLGELMLMDKS